MPDLDPTSRYAHLVILCQEYQEIIDLTQAGTLDTDEVRALNGQRSVLHEQLMAEMTRLEMPFSDRVDAMKQALKLARWLGMESPS
jgi:hypothetical protein